MNQSLLSPARTLQGMTLNLQQSIILNNLPNAQQTIADMTILLLAMAHGLFPTQSDFDLCVARRRETLSAPPLLLDPNGIPIDRTSLPKDFQ